MKAYLAGLFAPLLIAAAPLPIIDMHFHAWGADEFGPPGSKICAPYGPWPQRDPAKPVADYLKRFTIDPNCARAFTGPATDQALLNAYVAKLRRHIILAVASGPAKLRASSGSPKRSLGAAARSASTSEPASLRCTSTRSVAVQRWPAER